MERDVLLTQEGFEKLKEELQFLQDVKRLEVAERIKEAREFGDISENSEYDDAKNEQAMIEAKIAQLEERLRDATVIDAVDVSTDSVALGSMITIETPAGKATYQLVGSAESDPDEDRLSNESPIGRAILGHKKGETVDVVTPGGPIKVKIVSIKAA